MGYSNEKKGSIIKKTKSFCQNTFRVEGSRKWDTTLELILGVRT